MAEVSSNLAARVRSGPAEDGPFHIAASLPRVVSHLVTKRTLVMTYEAGARLTDPDAIANCGVDISAFIRMVARAYAQQMFSDGLYNADPHPGNFLVSTAEGTMYEPVLLDFGLATHLTSELIPDLLDVDST